MHFKSLLIDWKFPCSLWIVWLSDISSFSKIISLRQISPISFFLYHFLTALSSSIPVTYIFELKTHCLHESKQWKKPHMADKTSEYLASFISHSHRYYDNRYGLSCTPFAAFWKNSNFSNVARNSSFRTRSQNVVRKSFRKQTPSNTKKYEKALR